MCQNLSSSRASATEEKLRSWFKEVEEYLKLLDLLDIEGSRVFNMDESAFYLIPKGEKVLARKGVKAIYKVVNGDDKESLTVLFAVSGSGVMLPPMILFWYQRVPATITRSLPPEWIAGITKRGWMTADCFYEYILNIFYPWLLKNKIQFPIILYLDGHVSHLTLKLSQFCKDKKIELVALYPNAMHILQPLDVAVFNPLKKNYRKVVDEHRMQNMG